MERKVSGRTYSMTSMLAGIASSHAPLVMLLEPPPALVLIFTRNPTSWNDSRLSDTALKTRGAAVWLTYGLSRSGPPGVEVLPIVRYQLPSMCKKASDGSRKSCGLSAGRGITFHSQGYVGSAGSSGCIPLPRPHASRSGCPGR